MSLNNLVSKIPAWLGFVVLSAIGALMFIHGAVDPLDVKLERGEKAGFIIFGLCMVVIGAVSLILRAKSNLAGRTGVVGAKVGIAGMPWYGWVINGGALALSLVLFLVIK